MTGKPGAPATRVIDELYSLHGKAALAYARSLTDAHSAEDAVQEAFLRLMRYARPDSRPIDLPYLLATVRNEIRRAKSASAIQQREDTDVAATPEQGQASWPVEVSSLLAGLSGEGRAALELTCVRGLDARRAAEALGVGERAVTRQKTIAIRTLRRAVSSFLERRRPSETCAQRRSAADLRPLSAH